MQVPIKDACKNEEIASDPFLNVEKAYHVAKTRGVLTPAEVEKIEAAPVTDPFRRLAVLLAVRYGLRMGEVRGLQWGDIADGIITICHNYVYGDGLKNPKGVGGLIREKTCRVLAVGTVQAARAAAQKQARYTGAGDFVIQTGVTLGRLAGFSDAEIQALAGHANSRMMENYSHIADVLDFTAMREKLKKKAGQAPPSGETPTDRASGAGR